MEAAAAASTTLDWATIVNLAVGLMSLVLGIFAICFALYLYTKSKDAETNTTAALAAIRTQSDALQRLTGKWMDRFTRHATEPRVADEGLMELVRTVAALPTTILARLNVVRSESDTTAQQALREAVGGYIGLYYYSAQTNVLAQALLPSEEEFDPQDPLHAGIQASVERAYADFEFMTNVLNGIDPSHWQQHPLRHLIDEAITRWHPYVRRTAQAFEAARQGN